MALKRSNLLGASLMTVGLALIVGCGGKPAATPSPAAANATATPSASASPGATSSPGSNGTPQGKSAEEKEYEKLKNQAESLTLGKGYAEAVPLLRECLKQKPDDSQVDFYLMLSLGNLEEEPSPESEAYTFAKKVVEKAPGTPMAERANDYINSAESEPEEPPPDLKVESIEGTPSGPPEFKKNTAYILATKITVYLTRVDALTLDVKKKLWYLEVRPDAIPAEDKLTLPKGASISVQKTDSYYFSKNAWKGGPTGRSNDSSKTVEHIFDKNYFCLLAIQVRVESGPSKGQRGWFCNQMDRYKGVDEDGNRVWGVKVAPRLVSKDKH